MTCAGRVSETKSMQTPFDRAKALDLIESKPAPRSALAAEAFERAKAWELAELQARIRERQSK